jgi:hypothetical protein
VRIARLLGADEASLNITCTYPLSTTPTSTTPTSTTPTSTSTTPTSTTPTSTSTLALALQIYTSRSLRTPSPPL